MMYIGELSLLELNGIYIYRRIQLLETLRFVCGIYVCTPRDLLQQWNIEAGRSLYNAHNNFTPRDHRNLLITFT
jgi:hypothetical protein